jgi:hypothetical protein
LVSWSQFLAPDLEYFYIVRFFSQDTGWFHIFCIFYNESEVSPTVRLSLCRVHGKPKTAKRNRPPHLWHRKNCPKYWWEKSWGGPQLAHSLAAWTPRLCDVSLRNGSLAELSKCFAVSFLMTFLLHVCCFGGRQKWNATNATELTFLSVSQSRPAFCGLTQLICHSTK